MNSSRFTPALLDWFFLHGRKNLPWQHPNTPYHVWISEVMLQQTQVKTVIPYFLRFIERFPSVKHLAEASEDDVLAYWSGLGYYRRGRNLPHAARLIQTEFNGVFPSEKQQLITLPGIGDSTAAAIASLAFNKPEAILDGNVKRILSRYFLISGAPDKAATKKTLQAHADACMSQTTHAADYTQAIMDLGATVCTPKKTACSRCPLQQTCKAYAQNLVEQYPEKAQKKMIPTREQQFILLYNTDKTAIYLEKRPSEGLWGGLWSLPSLDMSESATNYTYITHGLDSHESIMLPMVKHTFSHFKLNLHPRARQVHINTLTQRLPTGGRWVKITDIKNMGLAKPIRSIIEGFLR
ncbi:MAG: A/G-specific adenine glycosylase [Legionella sp.]|nr:A/G-specific adenine glycosylase [Legionella sp.]